MTSLLTTANRYGWAGKNLRAGLGARRHPAGTNAPASGSLSLSTFSGQYPVIQENAGVVTDFVDVGCYVGSIAVDSSGNLFVADNNTGLIKKITSGGIVSTLASGLNAPSGIVADLSGNLFVPDTGLIKKITPGGSVSTFASGFSSEAGALSIAIDPSGNLFVGDYIGVIKKITPGGSVSTFASGFSYAYSIAVDSSGNLVVLDYGGLIKKITSGGSVSTFLTSETPLSSIVIDISGTMYVTSVDPGDIGTIKKITPGGVISLIAGGAGGTGGGINGTGPVAAFYYPGPMCINSSGNLFVGEGGAFTTIRKIT